MLLQHGISLTGLAEVPTKDSEFSILYGSGTSRGAHVLVTWVGLPPPYPETSSQRSGSVFPRTGHRGRCLKGIYLDKSWIAMGHRHATPRPKAACVVQGQGAFIQSKTLGSSSSSSSSCLVCNAETKQGRLEGSTGKYGVSQN